MAGKQQSTYILELTKACNNNCLYCYNVWKADKSYPEKELKKDEWYKLIDKIYNHNQPKTIGVSGGEPLLNKNVFDIIKYIKNKGCNVTLITNGTLTNKKNLKLLKKQRIDNLEIPLLGDNAKTHDDLTQNLGSWQKVINSIYEIKKQRINLTIVFVLTKQNINQIQNLTEMAIALGANSLLVNHFNVGGRGLKNMQNLTPSLEDLKSALKILNKYAKEYEFTISLGIPTPKCIVNHDDYPNLKFSHCPLNINVSGQHYYAIDPAGNLRPCNHSKTIIGNILKEDIENILNSTLLKSYIKASPAICKTCKIDSKCPGGCKASAEAYYNKIDELPPFIKNNL